MTPYYDHDGITIYNARCEDVLPSLSDVACVVTSPPYNQLGSRIKRHPGGIHNDNKWVATVNDNGYEDERTEDDYASWQAEVADLLADASRPGASFFYNHKVRYRDRQPLHPLDLVRSWNGWQLRQEVIWDRRKSMVLNARMFAPSDERIYWMVKPDAPYVWHQESVGDLSVWQMQTPNEVDGHPCPFPEALVARCIRATTNPGDIVLDPFVGSGTTLKVAYSMGRRAIGIELVEDYCTVAVTRLRQQALDFGGAA